MRDRLLKNGVSRRDPALRAFWPCSHADHQHAALSKKPRALADGPTLVSQHPAVHPAGTIFSLWERLSSRDREELR
jgi:hypothetical protein